MKPRWLWFAALPGLLFGLTVLPGFGDQPKPDPAVADAIQKQAEAFIEAFHRGDAHALAAFWTENGDYTDLTGHEMKGREAIEKAFRGLFAEVKGLKLRINSDSLRVVAPDVALEDGVTEVFPPDGAPPSRARFSAVHVKQDGRWLLASVRDAAYTPPSNYEHLKSLEWAIGDWAQDTDKGEVERLSVSWADSQNFVVANFSTTFRNMSLGSATQWIGWDPVGKRVRSWIFDETGAFGEGAWSQEGRKWVVKTSTVLQDGKKATATFTVGPVDADTISLTATHRTVDGKALPDTKEIRLKRVKAAPPMP